MGGDLRALLMSLPLLLAGVLVATAQSQNPGTNPQTPGYEIVRHHSDVEVNPDGSFLDAGDSAYRVLNAQGLQQLQQMTLTYTQGFQAIEIARAYTLKANGTRIDVPHGSFLYGRGATTAPGFEDIKTVTIVFPDLEIGDQVVLATVFRQIVPWFSGQFSMNMSFSRALMAHDEEVDLTAPENYALTIDAQGMDGGPRDSADGKKHWSWQFHNDTALKPEPDSVAESDDGAQLNISSFSGYDNVAHVYQGAMQGKDEVTPEIQALADQLTAGITDRREQTRVLYEWVSTHISYVEIVLGAGGFVPHPAEDVLSNRFGDCKDHVMLLDALLAAKKIDSSPVMINAGYTYRLSTAPSPFMFNHLINYVPEFHLFLDSTAHFAPFGVLPESDADKPVVLVSTGEVSRTPAIVAADDSMSADETIKVSSDGTAVGDTHVTAAGAAALEMRALMSSIPVNGDGDYLRQMMGPGVDGTLERGDIMSLAPAYSFTSHYRLSEVASFPGPGAMPPWIGYKPFYFTMLLAGVLPPSRTRSYVCPSITADERVTIELPPGVQVMALPKTEEFHESGIVLKLVSENLGHGKIRETTHMRLEHPHSVCTADYYNGLHSQIAKMVGALRGQILYK